MGAGGDDGDSDGGPRNQGVARDREELRPPGTEN